MAGLTQSKCRIGIMRQAKASLSARAFFIYVDGVKTTSIKNGGLTCLSLSPGPHVLGFGIGSKISCKVNLNLSPGDEANIICHAKGSGVEASLSTVDVCSLVGTVPHSQSQSNGSGCFAAVIGLILILLGLGILGVKFRLFFFLVPN